MGKLSLMERMRISRKYNCKLQEELYDYGIISIWTGKDEVWAIEEGEKATKISESKRKFVKFNLPSAEGLFLIGTEGLFYVNEGEELEKVYGEEIRGVRTMLTGGIVILFLKEKDIVIQLNPNAPQKIEKMLIGTVKILGNREVKEQQKNFFGASRERSIVIKEGKKETVYTIGIEKKGLHKRPN